MRAEYDRQLRELEEELFDMGSMCQQAVAFSGAVLIGDDETLREQVCSLEMEIDKKDRQIENICTGLLLRQTPVAGDLRFVSAALKIVSDILILGSFPSARSRENGFHYGDPKNRFWKRSIYPISAVLS